METTSLTIKLKGTHALHALTSKLPAAAVGKAAMAAAPIEGARWVAVGKTATAKSAATLKSATLAATKGGALAAGVAIPTTGTIWSGTGMSLGLGLGLGALGPMLLLGALGLTATGIYLYRRGQLELDESLDDAPPKDEVAAQAPQSPVEPSQTSPGVP